MPILSSKAMHETETMADRIREALPQLMRGSLRFWGAWFGRPYDNLHAVVGCEAKNDLLSIYFNEEEVLKVWEPRKLTLEASTFQIRDAQRMVCLRPPKNRRKSLFQRFRQDRRPCGSEHECELVHA